MTLALCVFVPALAVTSAYAAAPIEWSPTVKLTLKDFRNKVPPSTTDAAHAWVALDVAWECRDGIARSHARAIFDPDQSWWRGGTPNIWGGVEEGLSRSQLDNRRTSAQRDQDLLQHEQLHFDLTELAARKIRRELDDLARACTTPGSNDAIGNAVAAIEGAWSDEQARYDKDTDHGTNRVKQRQWELRVRKELRVEDAVLAPRADLPSR
jgi:hypothetical protein